MGHLTIRQRTKIPTYDSSKDMITGLLGFDDDKCRRCNICVSICPGRCILMDKDSDDKKSLPYLDAAPGDPDATLCIACGCCLAACPHEAISIDRSFRAGYYYSRITQALVMTYPKRY